PLRSGVAGADRVFGGRADRPRRARAADGSEVRVTRAARGQRLRADLIARQTLVRAADDDAVPREWDGAGEFELRAPRDAAQGLVAVVRPADGHQEVRVGG